MTEQQRLLSAQETKLMTIKESLEEKDTELDYFRRSSAESEIRLTQLTDVIEGLRQGVAVYKDRIAQIYTSRSWRVTKPLRSVMMTLRGTKVELPDPGDAHVGSAGPDSERFQKFSVENTQQTKAVILNNLSENTRPEPHALSVNSRVRGTTHVFTSVNACYIPKGAEI